MKKFYPSVLKMEYDKESKDVFNKASSRMLTLRYWYNRYKLPSSEVDSFFFVFSFRAEKKLTELWFDDLTAVEEAWIINNIAPALKSPTSLDLTSS